MFETDMKTSLVRLEDTAKQYRSNQPRAFYNDLHISPLMIHLSFSQGGTTGESSSGAMPIQSEFFKVLFQSVGVSVTELQDVVFKLAYFERKRVFYRSDQLNSEIISHYTMQALRQMYVLVLGLDIIGNPFGLVRDLSAGVEDLFYQPFQGLVLGPEEFATGVALGVQSMFGHAVGGAAGAVGRITGTVGKGVAALTFDQEYQRKRQVLSKRTDMMGTWATDWQTEYDKIKEPIFVENGIKLVLKEKKRGFLGIGSTEGKIITFANAEAIQQKVMAAYKAATELPI
ncbi:hypothetical protein ANCDUO_13215 [Ancylostoma duodenale]|uniref:Intermembrane lipid transfer protein VPS13-like C-terminal domain-containing protein n=1 Tax=Ancylostoma duodenale TaxID=51022 RepID=A0A0C2GCJ9_9BILA|nr:hypothetical protein ANCDUO_13215 [Ancylostoma duodenale]